MRGEASTIHTCNFEVKLVVFVDPIHVRVREPATVSKVHVFQVVLNLDDGAGGGGGRQNSEGVENASSGNCVHLRDTCNDQIARGACWPRLDPFCLLMKGSVWGIVVVAVVRCGFVTYRNLFCGPTEERRA